MLLIGLKDIGAAFPVALRYLYGLAFKSV